MTKVEQAIEELKKGNLVVLLDDLDRENEGDLVGLPEYMNSDAINFMITQGKGLLCAPLSKKVALNHKLRLMPQRNSDGTNFMESLDASISITGISAKERMETFEELLSEDNIQFRTPGHLFPLLAKEGGLSVRRGHTEASIDLAKLIGGKEVAAIIEIIKEDGDMARRDWLIDFAKKHNLVFFTIEDMVQYIQEKRTDIWEVENLNEFEFSSIAKVPTTFGLFDMQVAKDIITNEDYIIVSSNVKKNPNVRVHSACITSESFGSKKCDCKIQLDVSLELISKEGGMVIYTPDEGRGLGIFNKINAYAMQDQGFDTVDANIKIGHPVEARHFNRPGKLLREMGIDEVILLTNNPLKIKGIEKYGVKVSRKKHWMKTPFEESKNYLKVKIDKMNHMK